MRPLSLLSSLLLALLVSHVSFAAPLPADRSIAEAIDHFIDAALQEQKVRPAPPAEDGAILRRLTLDLVGRIPTAGEVKAYLASRDPHKKTQLVDRLMASGGFVRHQATEFDTQLAAVVDGRNRASLRDYLLVAFKEDRSWDRIFRDLILADEKAAGQKGAAVFLKSRIKDLDKVTNDVSVLFFGINVSCAQCHDHPLVHDWKQDHYYGMKSFFARTYESGAFLGERDRGVVEFKTTKNVTRFARMMFLTGKVVAAPGSEPPARTERKQGKSEPKTKRDSKGDGTPPPAPMFSARAALVDLALQPDQRHFFARALVNRVWHRLFGQGLVNPIDQMHAENEPSHPELLDWLARDTAEHGYDLRRLIRGIVLSNAYTRSSRHDGERWPPLRSFAVARVRALTPMQLAVSLRIASSDPEQFPATLRPDELDRRMEALENSARGLAGLFEQPRDDFQISVTEALLFSNNDRLQRELLADGRDRLLGRLKDSKSPEEAIDLAVGTVLNRPPSSDEKKAMLDYLAARRDRLSEGYKQMMWALLTSAEFRFNH